MKRTQVFLLAILLPLIAIAVYAGAAGIAHSPVALASAVSVADVANQATSESGAPASVLADAGGLAVSTEVSALESRLEELKSTLEAMDEAHAWQVQEAQTTLAAGQQEIQAKQTSLANARSEAEALQTALGQDAQTVEQQVAAWQAYDSELRQNLDATLTALDAAYAELTSQPAIAAPVDGAGAQWVDDDSGHEGDEHEEHDDD